MLTVIGLLSTTFGVSMAGALMPLISVELFVVGLALSGPDLPWWVLALVIAVGQAAGKLLYYYAAQGIVPAAEFPAEDRTGCSCAPPGSTSPPDPTTLTHPSDDPSAEPPYTAPAATTPRRMAVTALAAEPPTGSSVPTTSRTWSSRSIT